MCQARAQCLSLWLYQCTCTIPTVGLPFTFLLFQRTVFSIYSVLRNSLSLYLPCCRWLLRSPWAFSSYSGSGALWSGAQSLCSGSHSHGSHLSWRSHHCDCYAGGDVSVSSSANPVSTLPAAHHHPHHPWRWPHEYPLLSVLLLCRVSVNRAARVWFDERPSLSLWENMMSVWHSVELKAMCAIHC